MGKLYDTLMQDVRFREGLNACINCGTCTAICPAAAFYDYDPREIADTVQMADDNEIENLLKSDKIWYCGQCLSCVTRCPRNNKVGYIIQALRTLSQKLGYFAESEKGRQQLALKRNIGQTILDLGYCVYVGRMLPEKHLEAGPVYKWVFDNANDVMDRCGANYQKDGPGVLRKISQDTLDELKAIFDETGGTELFENIEKFSKQKAEEMGLQFDETGNCEYMNEIFTTNNGKHTI